MRGRLWLLNSTFSPLVAVYITLAAGGDIGLPSYRVLTRWCNDPDD